MSKQEEKQNRIDKRNTAIRSHYWKLRSEKEDGVKKYSPAYCLTKTAQRFFLSPNYIENIIYGSVKYKHSKTP